MFVLMLAARTVFDDGMESCEGDVVSHCLPDVIVDCGSK